MQSLIAIMPTQASTAAAFTAVPSASSFTYAFNPLPIHPLAQPTLSRAHVGGFRDSKSTSKRRGASKTFRGVPGTPIRLQNVKAPQGFVGKENGESDEVFITAPVLWVLIKNDQYLSVNTSRQKEPLHRHRRCEKKRPSGQVSSGVRGS